MLVVQLLHRLQRIDLRNGLIRPDTHNTREPQRVAARVAIALLDAIESHFKYYRRLDETEPAIVLNGVLLEELRHFGNLNVGEPGICFPDIQEFRITVDRKS